MAQPFAERILSVLRSQIVLKGIDIERYSHYSQFAGCKKFIGKMLFQKDLFSSTYTFYLLFHLAFHMLCWLPKHIAASFSAVLLLLLFPGAIVAS